jgi:hypothetical protein
MKPFICFFVPLFLIVLGLGYWGLAVSFPAPDPGPVPEWKQKLGSQVFDAVIFPARWSGKAAIFVGAACWAFPPSLAFAIVRRRGIARTREKGPKYETQ